MKIGKYTVLATTVAHQGGFVGTANLTWDEGGETLVQQRHFEKVCPTAADAEQHVYEQIALRVQNGAM